MGMNYKKNELVNYNKLMSKMREEAKAAKAAKKKAKKSKDLTPQNDGESKGVTPEKRRRDSLMNNQQMRYAFSSSEFILHDRDCIHVKDIPDTEFCMTSDFVNDSMKYCTACYRRALIRSAINPEESKWINAYAHALKLIGACTTDLKELILTNKAQLFDVQLDGLSFKVHDDTWQIRKEEGRLLLFHNSYNVLDDYSRVFRNEFHLQHGETTRINFSFCKNVMRDYSWPDHVKSMKEKKAQQYREILSQTDNFVRKKRFSLLFLDYLILDCNNKAPRYLHRRGVKKIELEYEKSENLYKIRVFRIQRWKRKRFLDAMEDLKEYSVKREFWNYAEQCSRRLHFQQTKKIKR